VTDTVCIYSGGMDSFTLLHELLDNGELHSALSFNYGQRHKKELEYAARECKEGGIVHHVIDLRPLANVLRGSALTEGAELPLGVAPEHISQRRTIVPSRNMIMLSIATAYAVSHGAGRVVFGAHAGDRAVYPDCRPEFVSAMNTVGLLGNFDQVQVEAPYLAITKREIILRGFALNLDYSRAWTCYEGGVVACGQCGACLERLDGFARAHRTDPMEYAK